MPVQLHAPTVVEGVRVTRAELMTVGGVQGWYRQTLESSFSAVSTATIARIGAFFQIFRDLQDSHPFAPLESVK